MNSEEIIQDLRSLQGNKLNYKSETVRNCIQLIRTQDLNLKANENQLKELREENKRLKSQRLTEEELVSIIRETGEYRNEFAVGLQDKWVVYALGLAQAILKAQERVK